MVFCVIKLVIRYNTALPSSAEAERLFSTAGTILLPKMSSLTVDRPINPLFLKIDDDGIFSHDLAHYKHIGTNFIAFDPIGTWHKWPKVWLFWPILAVLGQK